MPRIVIAVLTVLLLVAGCSSSSDDGKKPGDTDGSTSGAPSTSGSAPAPKGPDCADVWKDGATLPANYVGCVEDGKAGRQETVTCKDGSTFVAFSDIYYAVTGGKIHKPEVAPMQDTKEYGKAYTACAGD